MTHYKPELDFQFDDLSDKQLNMIFDKKPSLKENFYKDMFIITGKQKYLNGLKEDKEFNDKYNKWVQRFKDNFTMETNVDEYNPKNEFFFNKDGKVRMENLNQYEQFWVDYDDIWLKVEADFGDNYYYARKLI